MSAPPLRAIGELIEPVSTWTPERDAPDGVFTYVDLSAVDQDAKVVTGARELACSEAPSRARQLVRAGDVLVSTVRPNLNGVALVPVELDGATASTGFCVLRPRAGQLDSRYLYQWVKSPRFVSDMVRKATGASYPAVSDRIVWESKLPLPPLPEQRRIAEILDKADALRAKRRAALKKLDELTQSIFLDMFGDPATNPKGWPVVTLESKCTIAGEYGANVPSTEFNPDLPRYVRITDVTEEGELNDQPVSPAGSRNDWEQYELAPGDLLFARSGATVGKTYMHKESVGRCVFAGYMIRFRPDRRELLSEYLFAFTGSTAYRAWVAARQRVVAQPNINAKQYGRELLIPLPPIQQQEAFAARMLDIERTKTLLRKSREALDELCKALQRSAFRGQL